MDPIGVPHEVAAAAAAAAAGHNAPPALPAPAPSSSSYSKRLLKPGDRVSSRFRVLRMINAGGCAEVYEAVDETTGEHVAVKVETHSYSAEALSPVPVTGGQTHHQALTAGPGALPHEPPICQAALASLAASLPEFAALRELGALGPERFSSVRARGVPPVLEMGVVRLASRPTPPGAPPVPRRLHPYIAMHLGGRDFEEEGEALSGQELVESAKAAVSALRALHATGRIHRDLKPSNLVNARPVEHAARALALRRCREALEASAGKAPASAAAAAAAGAVQLPRGASSSPTPKPAGETTEEEEEEEEDDDNGYASKAIKRPLKKSRKSKAGATDDHDDDEDDDDEAALAAAAAASLAPIPWPFDDVCPAAAAAPLSRPRLYLIDYGFARRQDDEVRCRRGRVLFHGTPDFASLRALQGCPQRCKDDYEALAYVLLQLATGRLPWRLTTNSAAARGWTSDELASFARRKVALFERAVSQGLVPAFVERLLRYLWSLPAEEDADEARVDAIVGGARAWRGRPKAPSEDWTSEEEEEGGVSPRLGGIVPATTTEEGAEEEEGKEETEQEEAPAARPRPRAAARALPPAPPLSSLGPRASCPPDVPPTAANGGALLTRPRRRLVLSAPCSRLASVSGELDGAANAVGAAAAAEAAANPAPPVPPATVDAAEAAALAAEMAVAAPIVALHQVREGEGEEGAGGVVVVEQLGDRALALAAAEEEEEEAVAVAEGPPAAVEAGLLALDGEAAAPSGAAARVGAKRPAPLPPISAVEAAADDDDKENAPAAAPAAAEPAAAAVAVVAPPAAKRLRLSDDFGRQRQILMEEADE